jgi:hypothetical protein
MRRMRLRREKRIGWKSDMGRVPGKILRSIFLSISIPFALSGCGQGEGSMEIPRITIAASPPLESIAADLADAYSRIHPQQAPIRIKTVADEDIPAVRSNGEASAAIQWMEPPAEDWSALLGWTGIGFAVSPANPMHNISAEQARRIFQGRIEDWTQAGGSRGEIHPLAYERDNPLEVLFEDIVLADGRLGSSAEVVPGAEVMPSAIAADPLAIGFLLLNWKAPGVRILSIDGATADYAGLLSGKYPFRIPIFLDAGEGADPDILAFAGWAQSVSGQSVLMDLHARE